MLAQVTQPHVGVAELAERWGISKQAVSNLARKGLLPPATELKSGRVWDESTIQEWEQARRASGQPLPGERRGLRRILEEGL